MQILMVDSDATFEDVKFAYRKLALEFHPDKNNSQDKGDKFKKVTDAYNYLKNEQVESNQVIKKNGNSPYRTKNSKKKNWQKTKWHNPESDWGKFTQEFEEDKSFWEDYERQFWEDYERNSNKKEDFSESEEQKPFKQVFEIKIDESLCIGCCSCETIAPDIFMVNKISKMNPKSSVIDQSCRDEDKVMNAAETCPTKAILVDDVETKSRIYPW